MATVNEKMTALADILREKSGRTDKLGLDAMIEVASTLGSGGGDDGTLKGIIERTATEVTLPSDLTQIGDYAFYKCTNLTLTSLPSGVTRIGQSAFYNCANLALTSLPSGVTYIGPNAFYRCTKLALTSIPSGVTEIMASAFMGCTDLTSITFEGKPTTLATNAFNSCSGIKTINVPWASGEVANAPWGATKATINYNYTGG